MSVENKREKVWPALDRLNISYELTEHPAVFTIEEMENLTIPLQGEICKNLFLRDDKGRRHFLVVLKKDKQADLALLGQRLGSSRLGFASAERLNKYLGLTKGEVTPMGILNDKKHEVEVVVDADLEDCPRLGVHPNDNTATVWLSFADLIRLIKDCQNHLSVINLV